MISRRDVVMGAAALGVMSMLPLPARADQEVVLGEKTVGFNEDHDVIQVGRREGRFTHLKLAVRDNPVFLERVLVQYANGDVSELPVRAPAPRQRNAVHSAAGGQRPRHPPDRTVLCQGCAG